MATEETVQFGVPHAPMQKSVDVFNEILDPLKRELVHLRHDSNKHDPHCFSAVKDLSDKDLVAFTDRDFVEVRVAPSAYGIHLFGKVRIPAMEDSKPAYIHFRAFGDGSSQGSKLHSIHIEEKETQEGHKSYRAIFAKNDPLEWFNK